MSPASNATFIRLCIHKSLKTEKLNEKKTQKKQCRILTTEWGPPTT